MKRSALALILAVLMTVGLLTIGAAAEPAQTSYVDENGATVEVAAEPVTSELTAWSTGWYVVSSSVTIADRITVTGEVNLILADDSTLTATKGISVTSGNSLTIYGQSGGSGELTAKAKQLNGYAGIGGSDGNVAHGNITINGGIIKAESVGDAAGIGSGSGGSGTNGTITINGGSVTATAGGSNGAGIGGGYFNNIAGGDIVINGGTVTATGAAKAAGIGTGYSDLQTNGRIIKITGGTVNANGGMNAAGIGGGYGCKAKSIRSITINGTANVTATGGDGADNGGAGAGIGSGYGPTSDMTTNINIGGNAVVKATGGDDGTYGGAGIGSGGASGGIGNITISGGTVTATGGEGTHGGAGIGSGGYSKIVASEPPYSSPATGTLTINAGTVIATGGNGAAGIGDGANGAGGDFSTDRTVNGEIVTGKAVIYASSISDDDDSDWDGIIFQGNEGQVYGEIKLQNDLTLENGQTLTVPENSKLTVPTNKELVVDEGAKLIIVQGGTLHNKGEVTVQGALTSSGTISGSGTFTGEGAGDLDFAAEFNETKYAALNAAIRAANSAPGGGTVTLLKNVTISSDTTAMDEDVTLSVGSGKTLTVNEVSYLTSGALEIQTGGGLKLDTDTLVGTDGMVDLTEGTAKLDFNNVDTSVSLTLNGKASVVGSLKALWVTSNDQSSFVPMAITVTSGSKATVANGGVLNLVKGSSLTLADGAIFTAEGILEVHSTAKFADEATVSGKVYVFEAANGTNPIADASITLTSTGAVYAQLTELEGTTITPARMTDSDETYTSTSATELTTFIKQWTLSYKVTLNANGGTLDGEISELWTDANGNLETQPATPTWTGHTFSGWDSDNDGDVDYLPGATITGVNSDLELKAVWDVIYYTVTFDVDGSTYQTQNIAYNGKATEPIAPTKENYTFVGWYNGDDKYDFNTPVTQNIVLTAKWEIYKYTVSFDSAGGSAVPARTVDHGSTIKLLTVTKPGYIFMGWKCGNVTYQAGETVTITSDMTFTAIWANMPDITPGTPGGDDEPVVPDFPFTDVREGQWFYEAVKYVYTEGIMNGMDRYTFAPNGSLTRAMVWTMLARLDGVDTEGGATWYSKAQDWAMSLDVSDGTNPMGEITRQELVTMLWRYAYVCDADMTLGDDTNILSYIDIDKVSDWAVEAFQWCCGAGIIEGDENGALNPTAGCTRAEAAAMFMRLCKNVDLSPTV